MPDQFTRTELLLGAQGMDRLRAARVAVFGVGGVGSYTAEALIRSGVGALTIYDDDLVCLTNINRQLMATRKTVGQPKVEAMRARLLDINPAADIEAAALFYSAETADSVDLTRFDYVVDAIDTVSAKLTLIERARAAGVPVISCMGAGNKLDPTRFEITDIEKTSVCPLARVMRLELRRRGVRGVRVLYSQEPARKPFETEETSCRTRCVCPPGAQRNCNVRRQIPGSAVFVTAPAGYMLAGEVIRSLAGVQ